MTATPGKSDSSDEKRLQAIGAQINRIRKARGLKQKDLGEKIGVHEQTMTRYESGDGGAFSVLTAIAMAEALNVSLDQLVGRRGIPAEIPLLRAETEFYVRPDVLQDIKEAQRTGKWDRAREHFGAGFGFGIVLKPDALKVPMEQFEANEAEVEAAASKVPLRRKLRWAKEEMTGGNPRSQGRNKR